MISHTLGRLGCQQGDNKIYRDRPKRDGSDVGQKPAICGRFLNYADTCRNPGPALLIPRSQVRSLPGPYQKTLQGEVFRSLLRERTPKGVNESVNMSFAR